MAITVEVSREELARLASAAVTNISAMVDGENYADGDIGPTGWTSEELTAARDEVSACFDRAIELVRAWEEAGD